MKADKEKPSILFINRAYPPVTGATGRLLHDLARHLVKSGYRVTILSTDPDGKSHKSRGPITLTRVRGADRPSPMGYLGVLWRLYRAARKLPRHDLVVTMSDPPLIYMAGNRIAAAKGSKHIHWCQDVYPDLLPVLGYPISGWLLKALIPRARAAIAGCDKVVTISQCIQRHLVQQGLDIRRTAVIENWPDQELTDERAAPAAPIPEKPLKHRGALRQRRLYSDPAGQRFRILYAGNIGRAHPMGAVIQAARILQKSNPDIELVFVGKGSGFDALTSARSMYNLDNIRLMPPQPRHALKGLMESGDVHLVVMRDDAAGMLLPCKFYSALAVNRPMVFAGPAECDIAKIIVRNNAGKVVKPHDGKALATAIAELRGDADTWFAAQDGTKAALVGRTSKDAFAKWTDMIRLMVS